MTTVRKLDGSSSTGHRRTLHESKRWQRNEEMIGEGSAQKVFGELFGEGLEVCVIHVVEKMSAATLWWRDELMFQRVEAERFPIWMAMGGSPLEEGCVWWWRPCSGFSARHGEQRW
ncbi:hypothetical protein LR48_Vigan10g201000 [Vigna angularis]|uniref:Uncharacterized protein n=1 Tax=Phaseolus angularis TaxID=3914 RepID=A0A0L9VMC5_PHAAN|nr:hypothetical protein LR48_Vigan10g201000 [Vigna angularis]